MLRWRVEDSTRRRHTSGVGEVKRGESLKGMSVKKLEVEERRRLLSRDYTTEVSLAQGVYRWPARRWSHTDLKRDRLRCAMEYQAFGTSPISLTSWTVECCP